MASFVGKQAVSLLQNNVVIVGIVGGGIYVLYFTELGALFRKAINEILNPISAIEDTVKEVSQAASKVPGASEVKSGFQTFTDVIKQGNNPLDKVAQFLWH